MIGYICQEITQRTGGGLGVGVVPESPARRALVTSTIPKISTFLPIPNCDTLTV